MSPSLLAGLISNNLQIVRKLITAISPPLLRGLLSQWHQLTDALCKPVTCQSSFRDALNPCSPLSFDESSHIPKMNSRDPQFSSHMSLLSYACEKKTKQNTHYHKVQMGSALRIRQRGQVLDTRHGLSTHKCVVCVKTVESVSSSSSSVRDT